MPLVRVRYKEFMPNTFSYLAGFDRYWRVAIARELSRDESGSCAQLTSDGVRILLEPSDSVDAATPDLVFDIEASLISAEGEGLQEHEDNIRKEVRSYLRVEPTPSIVVCLKLVDTASSCAG